MRKIALLFIIFLFVSCDERSLGKNYYYLSEYDANEYLTESFVYKSFDENVFDEIIIYPKVKSIEFDNKYIIVFQQPNKELMLKQIKEDLELWNDHYLESKKDSLVSLVHNKMRLTDIHNLVKNKKEKLNITVDSIFNNEILYKKMFRNKSNYYIIQKANDSIFGPLTLKEFEVIKKKKSIDLDFE